MKREVRLFIEDILENIGLIENTVKDLSKEEFESDKDKIDAIVRRIEIIGEAVKNIPDPFKAKHKEVPWKDIAGMRDVIIHSYFRVDLNAVWKTVEEDIPELKNKIEKIKKEMEKN